jgi:SPW repeat-containing protein
MRSMWTTLVLGLWLMVSPFVLILVNRLALTVLWEDLLLGFAVATFSLFRLLSRRKGQYIVADWLIGTGGLLALLNPFLFSYSNATAARWNNILLGGIIFLLAIYQDWKDERSVSGPAAQTHDEPIANTGDRMTGTDDKRRI